MHVACDKYHTMALTTAGDVFAWGLEASGQLGLGSNRTKAPTPLPTPPRLNQANPNRTHPNSLTLLSHYRRRRRRKWTR